MTGESVQRQIPTIRSESLKLLFSLHPLVRDLHQIFRLPPRGLRCSHDGVARSSIRATAVPVAIDPA
jgi:hypothetical protein